MSYKFVNLCFSGGGVKGIAYGGALEALDARDDFSFSNIKRVAGTSAGAINACLLALGYSAKEVSELIANTNFSDFADDSLGIGRDIKRFFKRYGLYKGNAFKEWIRKRIYDKTGSYDTTFRELKDFSSTDSSFKELYVIGTNLSTQKPETYSHESVHSPDMKIADAIRISMSIPLIFRAIEDKDDQVFIDGGVIRNYAIDLFDHEKYLENTQNGDNEISSTKAPGFVFNHETLGFRLDEDGEGESSVLSGEPIPKDITNIKEYVFALISFMRQAASRMHLNRHDWNRTIYIDSKGVSSSDFKISSKQISKLIENGKKGVENHFAWRTKDSGMQLPS